MNLNSIDDIIAEETQIEQDALEAAMVEPEPYTSDKQPEAEPETEKTRDMPNAEDEMARVLQYASRLKYGVDKVCVKAGVSEVDIQDCIMFTASGLKAIDGFFPDISFDDTWAEKWVSLGVFAYIGLVVFGDKKSEYQRNKKAMMRDVTPETELEPEPEPEPEPENDE